MRAFVAVDAPNIQAIADLQRKLLGSAKWDAKSIKPVTPENFHFTLMFLGEVEGDANSVIQKLSEIRFKPFEISLQGVGCFPRIDSARVIWVGVEPGGGNILTALSQAVVEKMKELGFSPDKPFAPHLTIARAKNNPLPAREVLASLREIQVTSGIIDRIHLKKSELGHSGPVYSNVYTLEARN